jgi:DNA gyrase/topoisomerase IV subunit B
VTKNSELKKIASILGMDLSTNNNTDLSYENIAIATDADVDGDHIAGILLGLFQTYAPSYLTEGKIFLFVTPLVTVLNKKGQLKFLFTMEDYENFRKKYDPQGTKFIYDYKKGLGSMEENDWVELFKQFKLEDLLQPLHIKGSSNPEEELSELNNWLADNSDFRKDKILYRIKEFDINKI